MRYYWTDERHQIIYSKRLTHAVIMVGSCSRKMEFCALWHCVDILRTYFIVAK